MAVLVDVVCRARSHDTPAARRAGCVCPAAWGEAPRRKPTPAPVAVPAPAEPEPTPSPALVPERQQLEVAPAPVTALPTNHTSPGHSSMPCRADPEIMFASTEAMRLTAAKVCHPCRARLACLAEALDNRIEYGVWGALTPKQRRSLLARHPEVRSWREWLAREAGEVA